MPMDVNLLRQIMQKRAGMPTEGGQSGGVPASSGQSPQPSGAPPGTMSQQPMAQLQQSQPSEAMIIIKGLVNRLRSLPGGVPSGQQSNSS